MQCTNQLKQIGLAMHQYITDNDVLPPTGGIDLKFISIGTGRVPQNSSIHLRLTNYLEHRDVYDAYNFMLGDVVSGNSVAANTTVMSTSIAGYLCPSDANPGSNENLDVGYSVHVTCVNYAVNAGTNRTYFGGVVNRLAWWLGGNPSYGSRVGFTAVRDGTSNTAAFSEWVKGKAGQNAPGLNLVYQVSQLSFGGPQQDISACQAASTPLWDFKGEYWTLQDTGRGGPFTTSCRRTSRRVTSQPATGSSTPSSAPARFIPAASTSFSWTARSASSRTPSTPRSGTPWAPAPVGKF